MAFHVFLFFLVLCLAWLWHLYWLHHTPPNSRGGTIHTKIPRLLKPRTHLIVRPAASPPPSRRVWNLRLFLCAPGARSKAGGVLRNG